MTLIFGSKDMRTSRSKLDGCPEGSLLERKFERLIGSGFDENSDGCVTLGEFTRNIATRMNDNYEEVAKKYFTCKPFDTARSFEYVEKKFSQIFSDARLGLAIFHINGIQTDHFDIKEGDIISSEDENIVRMNSQVESIKKILEYISDQGGAALGLGLDRKTGQILQVTDNLAAKSAGILVGDYIVAIDEQPFDQTLAVNKLAGPCGQSVKLTIFRPSNIFDYSNIFNAAIQSVLNMFGVNIKLPNDMLFDIDITRTAMLDFCS